MSFGGTIGLIHLAGRVRPPGFDRDNPIARMLLGSTPCELRLMLPDAKLGIDGFHDIIIENLTASPTWRSSHISPADITALRRHWPKDVFRTESSGAGCGTPLLGRPEAIGPGVSS